MNFANDNGAPRSARSRRALPRPRRVWPYLLIALVIAGLAVGGTVWFLRAGSRQAVSFESVKKFFHSSPDKLAQRSNAASEKPGVLGKGKVAAKAVTPKKKPPADTRKAEPAEQLAPEALRAQNDKLRMQLQEMAPTGLFVVINTAGNRVILRNGDKVEAEMVASCGSGNVLEDPKGGRRWTFDTPRGVFTVKTKVADPVWIKPDWAFIEEGEPIPKNRADRAEPGMMGDFAIGIGDGYYIHGTLYSRLLGRNVSHGCVRLGDADIDRLYHTLNKGDRVYIF